MEGVLSSPARSNDPLLEREITADGQEGLARGTYTNESVYPRGVYLDMGKRKG